MNLKILSSLTVLSLSFFISRAYSVPQISKSSIISEAQSWKDLIKVSVYSAPTVDSRGETNLAGSNINLSIENQNLNKILNDTELESYDGVDTILALDVRVSGVPTFLKGQVEGKLDKKVDNQVNQGKLDINRKLDLAYTQVSQFQFAKTKELDDALNAQRQIAVRAAYEKVDAALQSSSAYNSLPPEAQTAFKQKSYADAELAVNNALAQIKSEKLKELSNGVNAKREQIGASGRAGYALADQRGQEAKSLIRDRLDQIQLETSIQEVSFLVSKVLGDKKNVLVFLKAGKFHPVTIGRVDQNYQSQLENVRPLNSAVQRGVQIAPTGAVLTGANFILKKGSQLQFDIIAAHDRPPVVDGSQYIGVLVKMTEGDFQKQQQFYAIDSVVLNTIYKSDGFDTYIAGGQFGGNQYQIQGGLTIRVNNSVSVIADATHGDRGVNTGASAFVVYGFDPSKLASFLSFSKSASAYGGVEYVDGYSNPGLTENGEGRVSSTALVAGMKTNFYTAGINSCKVKIDAKVEVQYYLSKQNYAKELNNDMDAILGTQAQLTCDQM